MHFDVDAMQLRNTLMKVPSMRPKYEEPAPEVNLV